MEIQYYIAKNKTNISKHGINLADAEVVLYDQMGITIEDSDHNELRYVTIGRDAFFRVLVVVWTECGGDCFRLISARKADRTE